MGKKSLIKSTAGKKQGAKEKEETKTKKTATKSTKKAAPKTTKKAAPKATKKTTAKKTASTATKKTAAKKTAKAAPKKTAVKKGASAKAKAAPKKAAPKKAAPKKAAAPKKVSIKELVFKKFEPVGALPAQAPASKPAALQVTAPPLIASTDPKEVERLRAVLSQSFSMDEIKAAAKAPEPASEPEPAAPAAAGASAPEPAADTPPAVQPAPESQAYITVDPTEPGNGGEPMSLPAKMAIAAAAAIIFLLLAVSYNNSTKYYIHPGEKAIEIWKGRFSPKDNRFFMVLHGTQMVEPIKEVYTREDVFPLVFNYYIDKSDALLEVPGLPDFEGIKSYLYQAEDFALTVQMKRVVSSRLNTIERMILLYKADVALSKDSQDALESAIKLLKDAAKLTPSAPQADEIAGKIEAARKRIGELKAETE